MRPASGRPALVLVGLLLVAGLAVPPTAEADHCAKRVVVHSRPSGVPLMPPPYTRATPRYCVQGTDVVGETLLPGADQVLVRFYGDGGPSWPTISVVLDGLGFDKNVHLMQLRQNDLGYPYYTMADYVSIPGGAKATGELHATVRFPNGVNATVVYRAA